MFFCLCFFPPSFPPSFLLPPPAAAAATPSLPPLAAQCPDHRGMAKAWCNNTNTVGATGRPEADHGALLISLYCPIPPGIVHFCSSLFCCILDSPVLSYPVLFYLTCSVVTSAVPSSSVLHCSGLLHSAMSCPTPLIHYTVSGSDVPLPSSQSAVATSGEGLGGGEPPHVPCDDEL